MPGTLSMFHHMVRKGWQPLPLKEGWQLKHRDLNGEAYITITEQWISMVYSLPVTFQFTRLHPHQQQVTDDLPSGEQEKRQPDQHDLIRGYRTLLERNERMFMVKFCL